MALDSFVGDGLAPSPYREAIAEIVRLQDELARLRADAERWRWARANPTWLGFDPDMLPGHIDFSIDAARGKL